MNHDEAAELRPLISTYTKGREILYTNLCPLDRLMERWMLRGDIFYARFQDDLILVARSKHPLKRVMKVMLRYIEEQAVMSLRREKTFIGRASAGFDFLGYFVTPGEFQPSDQSFIKASDKAKRCYARGGTPALAGYLKRWNTWVKAGLGPELSMKGRMQTLSHARERNGKGMPETTARSVLLPCPCGLPNVVLLRTSRYNSYITCPG